MLIFGISGTVLQLLLSRSKLLQVFCLDLLMILSSFEYDLLLCVMSRIGLRLDVRSIKFAYAAEARLDASKEAESLRIIVSMRLQITYRQ